MVDGTTTYLLYSLLYLCTFKTCKINQNFQKWKKHGEYLLNRNLCGLKKQIITNINNFFFFDAKLSYFNIKRISDTNQNMHTTPLTYKKKQKKILYDFQQYFLHLGCVCRRRRNNINNNNNGIIKILLIWLKHISFDWMDCLSRLQW